MNGAALINEAGGPQTQVFSPLNPPQSRKNKPAGKIQWVAGNDLFTAKCSEVISLAFNPGSQCFLLKDGTTSDGGEVIPLQAFNTVESLINAVALTNYYWGEGHAESLMAIPLLVNYLPPNGFKVESGGEGVGFYRLLQGNAVKVDWCLQEDLNAQIISFLKKNSKQRKEDPFLILLSMLKLKIQRRPGAQYPTFMVFGEDGQPKTDFITETELNAFLGNIPEVVIYDLMASVGLKEMVEAIANVLELYGHGDFAAAIDEVIEARQQKN